MEFVEDFHFKYMFYIFQLLPIVFKSNCWPVLSMVLEMFAYRLHYIQAPLRLQLLNTLQQGWIRMNFISVCKTPQLNVLIETTTLKLITGLGNTGLVNSSTLSSWLFAIKNLFKKRFYEPTLQGLSVVFDRVLGSARQTWRLLLEVAGRNERKQSPRGQWFFLQANQLFFFTIKPTEKEWSQWPDLRPHRNHLAQESHYGITDRRPKTELTSFVRRIWGT